MQDLLDFIILFVAGLAGGFLNALVSSGSAITLPLLIYLGLPPAVANATNRIPVVAGFLSSTLNFHRAGMIEWKKVLKLSVPLCLGTLLGVKLIEKLSDQYVKYILAFALVFSLVLAVTKLKKITFNSAGKERLIVALSYLLFFIIGIWGGLIVLDTATFILIALTLHLGIDLIKANAMKSALCLIFTSVSLILFSFNGTINWKAGIIISIGSMVGGWLGSQLALSEKSRIWLFRLLISVISFEIISMIIKNID